MKSINSKAYHKKIVLATPSKSMRRFSTDISNINGDLLEEKDEFDKDGNDQFIDKFFQDEVNTNRTGHISWESLKKFFIATGGFWMILFIIISSQFCSFLQLYYYNFLIKWAGSFKVATEWENATFFLY